MLLRALLVWVSLLAGAALAQTDDTIQTEPLDDPEAGLAIDAETDPFAEHTTIETERRDAAEIGTGGVLRALDKVTGVSQDIDLASGESAQFGRLSILLTECRYPADNPEGDAFAQVVVFYGGSDAPAFSGWMIASSPALSAMDHRRYDVWVLRCRIPSTEGNSDG